MLDIKFIRENPDTVRQAIINRNDNTPLDEILELDTGRRQKVNELEGLRHERKQASKNRQANATEEARTLRNRIKDMEEEVRAIDNRLEELLLQVPNIPNASVPIGKDEDDNVIVRSWGEPGKFDFQPAPHWDLAESLGIIDFERGVKLSGSRFYILRGLGARLQRALIAFMLDLHTLEHGYEEIYPP